MSAVVLVARVGAAGGARAAAAALACAGAEPDRAGLLVDLDPGRPPRPSLVATGAARDLEERLVAHLPEAGVASRGRICHLTLPSDEEGLERVGAALAIGRDGIVAVNLAPHLVQEAMAGPIRPSGALLRADLAEDRALTAPGGRRSDRARGQARGDEAAARLDRRPAGSGRCPGPRRRWRGDAAAGLHPIAGGVTVVVPARRRESGQAVVLAIGGSFALIAGALALVAIAGAVTGKGRAQRAADLAAISAARSMRDDLPRLLSPPTLPNGLPNPEHMGKLTYLLRARLAATDAGVANGVGGDEASGRLSRRPLLRPGQGQDLGLRRTWRAQPVGSRRRRKPKPPPQPAPCPRCRRSPPAADTAARSPIARGRGCGRTSAPPSTGWPPRPRRRALP